MEQRSEFVTVVAWIFIVLSGFGVLIMIMETTMFWAIPFDEIIKQGAALNKNQPQVSPVFFITLMRWFVVLIMLLQAWMLASSIGLLMRKNWARISFIVLLAIGLVWNGLGLIFGLLAMVGIHFVFNSGAMPTGMPPGFQGMMQVFMFMSLIIGIAFMVLFGWIIKKLVSDKIRREFLKPPEHSGVLMG